MNEIRRSDIPDDVVERRLEHLAQVDRLMRALRDVRFVREPSEVRDGPAPPWDPRDSPATGLPPMSS